MSLDVQQDEPFQQREWRFERVGWAVLATFVGAGLLGALGNGPLSWASARSAGGLLEVRYQRVVHHEADESVEFVFAPEAVRDGTVTLTLTGSWVTGVDRQGIVPEPSEERGLPDGVVLDIPVERRGQISLLLTFRAQDYGPQSAHVAVGSDQVTFSQLVLP